MRTHLLQLLLLLLLAWPAQVLDCHECTATRSCYQATSCKAGTRYCLTTWTTSPDKQTVVVKSCAYTCPGFQESLAFSRASCCNTDLCNSATGRSALGSLPHQVAAGPASGVLQSYRTLSQEPGSHCASELLCDRGMTLPLSGPSPKGQEGGELQAAVQCQASLAPVLLSMVLHAAPSGDLAICCLQAGGSAVETACY